MELRCYGELLLRSRALPALFFPAASGFPPQSTIHRRSTAHPLRSPKQLRCSFHTSPSPNASSSSSTTTDLDLLDDTPEQNPKPPPHGKPYQERASDSMIDQLLDSTLELPRSRARKPSAESSADILEAGHKASEYYSMRDRGNRRPGSLSADMMFPDRSGTSTGDSSTALTKNFRRQGGLEFADRLRAKRTIKSRPSIGRTVELNHDRDMDFGRALRTLEIQCAVNRVRADLQRQRFHERPGMKRKRLKSERWRKLFKESFKATVGRVKEMRRKGW